MVFILSILKEVCFIVGISLLSISTLIAQEPVYPGLFGSNLLDSVVSTFKPVSVLDYSEARDIMYGQIYNENDSVSCVYTGHTLFLPTNVDPSYFLWMNGSSNGINAEHTYPRSKGANEDSGNAFSDMHHLFPCRVEVNASRSNFPFGEIADQQTKSWFYLNQKLELIPNSKIDLYSERINGTFEPRESHKGNAARAVFYFYTMYQQEALAADSSFFALQRMTLCDWHKQDPVDKIEWERTYMIAGYQNDLANPFILDSTLVDRAYCGELVSADEQLDFENIQVFPNPISNWVHVKSSGKNSLLVIDVFGRSIIERNFVDSIALDFASMQSGNYIISVNGKVFRMIKL